ncbi:hypothetical protein B0T10DRAFT_537020 [Thelonectria olida]|uniref:Zn(2)-C6 fungal-type domain-containing protein n=1 Tax=Thelonectria olida TaxID=1576542 RepID=A0A9P9ARS4_9HYPO|nr:hypothetical protein B0T10DRAFT_537020 [Thelonectria olida]
MILPVPGSNRFPHISSGVGHIRRRELTATPSTMDQRVSSTKRSKACHACKTRKVRCSGYPPPCGGCSQRGIACVFGQRKVPLRKNVNKALVTTVAVPPEPSESLVKPVIAALKTPPCQVPAREEEHSTLSSPDLYIDQLLSRTVPPEGSNNNRRLALKGNGLFGGSYTITFFTDARLASLSARLQNNKVDQLVKRFSAVLKSRVKSPDKVSARSISQEKGRNGPFHDRAAAATFISAYFEYIHPLYPHLNRSSFEETAFSSDLPTVLTENKAFSALYHSVLALGCLYDGGGSFEPGKGRAWQLFSISLALFPELVQSPDSLLSLQAMATMAIYSLGISCLSIEKFIMTEAARRAQNLALITMIGVAAQTFRRTFWVLYSLEKMSSFFFGRNSAFIDMDITTPIPSIPESIFGTFDWFLTFARLSRILSRALTSLFSPGVSNKDMPYYAVTIDHLSADLEQWRLSLPEDKRPGPLANQYVFRKPVSGAAVLWTHYLYYGFRLILAKTYLQLTTGAGDSSIIENRVKSKEAMMSVTRSILELTPFIDVEPSTPLWVLAGIPIFALFILFEEVINDPRHKDAASNLALLDISGGHFSRIEYASEGSVPGSLIAEFSYIAREYVHDTNRDASQHQDMSQNMPATSSNGMLTQMPSNNAIPMTAGDPAGASIFATLPATIDTSSDFYGMDKNAQGQDPWIADNDLLLGINVMDIFSGFIPLPELPQ